MCFDDYMLLSSSYSLVINFFLTFLLHHLNNSPIATLNRDHLIHVLQVILRNEDKIGEQVYDTS
jgi:hypothetical protein